MTIRNRNGVEHLATEFASHQLVNLASLLRISQKGAALLEETTGSEREKLLLILNSIEILRQSILVEVEKVLPRTEIPPYLRPAKEKRA